MKVFALLADSLRETVARKSFLVMTGISVLFILLVASLSFRKLDETSALESMVEGFNVVSRLSGPVWARRYERVRFEIEDVHRAEGIRFVLAASPPDELGRLIHHWQGIRLGTCKNESDPIPEAELPVDPDLARRFLEVRFREVLLPDVEVHPSGPGRWNVHIPVSGTGALVNAEEIRFLFGAVSWRARQPGPVPSGRRYVSSAEIVLGVETALGELVMGFFGVLLAIVATAGSVPRMLEKGALDLLLSRPIGRTALLLVKYLGGCLQVFLGATLLVGGCWLALSARSGHWNANFLLTIFTLTFFFAVLYSVGVLVGVVTRSGSMAAVVTLLTWAVCFAAGRMDHHFASPDGVGARKGLITGVRVLHLLLPKTWDLGILNQRLILRGQGEEGMPAIPECLPLPMVFLSSAAFALVFLAWASFRFEKKDY